MGGTAPPLTADAAGDAVIAATAERLSTWAGSRTAVGRLGGDEFALTLRIARSDGRPAWPT
ncbi:diguanylate cyclase (plasmid) [Streptomyces sp. NBC_01166]|uniref:diguanylate cyclase domain-containing protein n=1 Tax=Streptomyces sp. NBC_01166 TaxID=2903755 RepID=UPI002F90C7B2|nr:diguanylate cyclase [Streptomyces sp. NBC_01166]